MYTYMYMYIIYLAFSLLQTSDTVKIASAEGYTCVKGYVLQTPQQNGDLSKFLCPLLLGLFLSPA